METLLVALLGAIQGATEFLPVSSSGHLAAGQLLIFRSGHSLAVAAQPLLLEIILHLATLLAVIAVYRKDVLAALTGFGRGIAALPRGQFRATLNADEGTNLAFAILVGTIPTAITGIVLRDSAMSISRSPFQLGLVFVGCGLLLLASRWWKGGEKPLSLRLALIIGLAQGFAVLPGMSRSGTTIIIALALGLPREQSAKFSFLLSLPAIAGAAILEFREDLSIGPEALPVFAVGGLAAFLVGLGALHFLIRLVKQGRIWLFAPYMFAVGAGLMLLL